MRFKTIQPDNPILRAEISYQQRTTPRWLQWFDRFGVIILALIIGAGLLLFPLIDDQFGQSWPPQNSFLKVILPVLWITQLVVIFRCVFVGVNIMQHHKGWQQWDVFVLTGITRKQFLIGKLWGALYQLRGWIVALGVIKLAVFAFVIIDLIVFCYRLPLPQAIADLNYYSRDSLTLGEAILKRVPYYTLHLPPINRIVMSGIHIIAISLLEIMASVATGIIGGLLLGKAVGFTCAIVFRLIPVVGFSLFPDFPNGQGDILWRWHEYTWFSLADGGSTAIIRSGSYARGYADANGITTAVLLAFWVAIVMFIAYLLFAFLVSNFMLRRQGLLSAMSK
ncbi:MAG: hypothetical protein H0X30_34350 [Anaerolineae bacterium]|nr:hypothetical protein [Anaerolineae bacterium]